MTEQIQSTYKRTADFVEGTLHELTANEVSLNGVLIDAPAMSVLHRMGIAEKVGDGFRGEKTKGPTPKVYRLPLTGKFATVAK